MANAVEKLFDSVLSKLGTEQELDWPRINDSESEVDPVDEPCDSDEDWIQTADEAKDMVEKLDDFASRRIADQLAEADEEAIEGGLRRRGFDCLAFYKSRRMVLTRPFPGHWGIFYLKQALTYIQSQIAREYPAYGNPRKLALDLLCEHERFHYRADLQTLLFEATLGRSLYMPLRRALRGRRSHFVEEALANRHVWDWSKKASVGIEEFAYEFMKLHLQHLGDGRWIAYVLGPHTKLGHG